MGGWMCGWMGGGLILTNENKDMKGKNKKGGKEKKRNKKG